MWRADRDDPSYGSWVANVSLAYANGGLIKTYQDLSGFFRRIHLARVTAQKYGENSKYADAKRLRVAIRKLEALEKQFTTMNKRHSKSISDEVVGAYVTFNNQESADRCIKDYARSSGQLTCCCWSQPKPLQLQGRRVKVRRAPDPSQIVWENLELSKANQCCRRATISLVLIVLLAISFLFIMLAQAYQARFRARVPNLGLCNTLLPAVAYGRNVTADGNLEQNMVLPGSLDLVRDPNDPTCSVMGKSRLYWDSDSAHERISAVNASNPCLDECFGSTSTGEKCAFTTIDGSSISYGVSDTVACYCIERLRESVDSTGVFAGLRRLVNEDGSFCAEVAQDYIAFNALIIVASGVVVFVNTVLSALLKRITRMEGHIDLDGITKSVAFKVFLALFLNTGTLLQSPLSLRVCVC